MPPTATELWQLLPWGYLLTIVLETPVLLLCLSPRHAWQRRLIAGIWLTACTYPIVAILLPLTVWPAWGHTVYLVIAETFAPVAECAIFFAAFPAEQNAQGETQIVLWKSHVRDCVAIVVANLVSFIAGGYLLEVMR